MFTAVRFLVSALALLAATHAAGEAAAARPAQPVSHRIEGRVRFRASPIGNVRVRLVRASDQRPITETFARPEGQFTFNNVLEGDYLVETFETEQFEAVAAGVSVRPLIRDRPETFSVIVELSPKPVTNTLAPPGTLAADVDIDVPKSALKRYREGMKALGKNDSPRAIKEFQAAVELYPKYYAARLELARELRAQKRLAEAADVLRPLAEIAPRRAEPRVEYGTTLLSLGRTAEAIEQLTAAVRLEETSWVGHFALGWALIEQDGERAETHLRRSLELDERRAARAYLALARLADSKGKRAEAIAHLDAYLVLEPDGRDAQAARALAERLRSAN